MSADRAASVLVLPVGEDKVAVLHDGRGGKGGGQEMQWMTALSPLLTAAVRGGGGRSCAGLYELSPESQQLLKKLRRDEVGGYFRGVLRSEGGQTAHQLQLRPATGSAARTAPKPGAIDVAVLTQLASMQVQLNRIEDAIQDVGLDVKTILSFLEREQRAEIGAALDIVNEVYARSQQAGVVTAADWDRTAGTELVLRKQHRQVLAELLDRLTTPRWTGQPKADADAMRQVGPARVGELLDLLRLLAGGLWRWEEVNVLYRLASEAVTVADLASQEHRLVLLQQQHDEVLQAIAVVRQQAARTRERSNWSRLWSDGIVLGERHDKTNMAKVADGRKELKAATASRKAVTPACRPRLELAAA